MASNFKPGSLKAMSLGKNISVGKGSTVVKKCQLCTKISHVFHVIGYLIINHSVLYVNYSFHKLFDSVTFSDS